MAEIIHYHPPGPIGRDFIASDAFVCGIRGPLGSGKSTASVIKLIRAMRRQKPGADKIRHRRTAIIRNTYGELKTTTIKTWHQWMPASVGKWTEGAPPTHRIRTTGVIRDDEHRTGSGRVALDWEVMFVALDRPEDVRKLLSMELSDAWINEAREIPKAVLDGLTGRVGRFPAVRDGGCTDPQIIMDTNSPDTDHWWAKLADFPTSEFQDSTAKLEEELHAIGSLRADQRLYQFFAQPGGRHPQAENIKNLEAGYYLKAMAGKSPEWIKVYIDAEYGFVVEGKPVYPEYKDTVHCQPFELNRSLPIYVGIDFGLTPAAIIGQKTYMGGWRCYEELVATDMGARRFGELLRPLLKERFQDRGIRVAGIYGDPSGDDRAQSDETTPFQMLRAVGVDAHPAPTNDPTKRREAVVMHLNRMVDGQPSFLVHPRCPMLRKAMAGGYHRRRVQIVGEERYHEEPVKNEYSHIADACQYMLMGAGEGREVVRRDPSTYPKQRSRFAVTGDSW